MFLAWDLLPRIQGPASAKKSAPWHHAAFLVPQHQGREEGGLLALGEGIQGCEPRGHGRGWRPPTPCPPQAVRGASGVVLSPGQRRAQSREGAGLAFPALAAPQHL